MKSKSDSISKILKNYDLCDYCVGRLISKILKKNISKFLGKKYLLKSGKKCFICKNIFDNFDNILLHIFENLPDIDFKTFNLGIILKPSFLERDDYIKSKFKIKGVENLKFGVSKELTKKISRKTHTQRLSIDPDLFIQVNFKDESCIFRTKPLFIYGRYNKKIRNIPQKQDICHKCNGFGCHNCNFIGKENFDSIERKISNFFIKKFECNQVKINWIGGEDKSSLVLGNGRPFFAKLLNPKKRNKILKKNIDLEGVNLFELKKLPINPKGHIQFKSEVLITVETKNSISSTELKKLKTLQNSEIKDFSKAKKSNQKKIYKLNYKKTGKKCFILHIFADGGFSIKSFIQNSDVIPNVSEILENPCICKQFDFRNVIV